MDLKLRPREVHVWYSRLDVSNSTLASLHAHLSQPEKERANQYFFGIDRNRYIARHGTLRLVLAAYTQVAPSQVEFYQEPGGKPALTNSPISFNMSRSKDLAVYAIAMEAKLGVDIEWIKTIPEEERDTVARQFFSKEEFAGLMATPPQERTRAFFRCWTRTEAFVKARGLGLRAPLDSFQISAKPGKATDLRAIEANTGKPLEWTVLDLKCPQGYAGALVLEGLGWHVKQERWGMR